MTRFNLFYTPIQGLKVIQRLPIEDDRGFLSRFYCVDTFADFGVVKPIAQINHTLTKKIGVVRGMHYQKMPYAETKLVSCLKGEVFDVAVDLRRNSPTFLNWYGEVLSAANQRSMLIPEGFAHGFQTLAADCELIYLHTASYNKDAEAAINAQDTKIGILWPLSISELSAKDASHQMVNDNFEGVVL